MERKRKRKRSLTPPNKRHRYRSRSRSRSHSPHRPHSKSYHQRTRSHPHNPSNYDEYKMSNRLKEIHHLRNELSKPSSYRPPNQKYSDQEYARRAEKRRNTRATISVWMESPERDATQQKVTEIEDEPVETFNEEREKHLIERKHHIKRHEHVINQRTFHPDSSDTESDTASSSSSESSSDSSTDSEYERRRRRKRKRRHKKRKKRHKKRKHRKQSKKKRHRKRDKKHHRSSSSEESESSDDDQSVVDVKDVLDKKEVIKDNNDKHKEEELIWIEPKESDSSESDTEVMNMAVDNEDDIGPKPIDDVTSKLDRRDYGGAMLPGEADAIANFVQRGMRIPRRGEVGLTSEEIAAFECTGFVMSGSRHKRMNAIRIRKENQIYSAEEKRALTMVNFEEKLNREKKLMAQYQKLLNEKTKHDT